jgi:glutathione S-transferase
MSGMIELYQAEWCPHSHRVRMRMTELGVSCVLHQVPADPDARTALADATGQTEIPTLVTDAGPISGTDAILAYLDDRYPDRTRVEEHRMKAAEEAGEWEWPATAGR